MAGTTRTHPQKQYTRKILQSSLYLYGHSVPPHVVYYHLLTSKLRIVNSRWSKGEHYCTYLEKVILMYYTTVRQGLHKPFGQGGFPTIGHTANRNEEWKKDLSYALMCPNHLKRLTRLFQWCTSFSGFSLGLYNVKKTRRVNISRKNESRGNDFFSPSSSFLLHSPPLYYFIDGLGVLVKYIADSALRHSAHDPASSFRITNHGQRNVGSRRITSQFADFCVPAAHLSSLVTPRGSDWMSHRSVKTHMMLSRLLFFF